ncbi:hypothetical protein AUR04nite_15450 [Glutamicibacter uratoxydans]|uniref:Uncharacterized protein n=1 Tax=Glutamicibacter uratoxydans TaxID=43667 RepID=A0A4Y4DN41_GLUUR|nr:hypothetical protein [Glutamicibacter uratoxydans]GED06013.1 hypothetical protein AUR04nite_15450 [Glutamicibacter uratoxydans]
MSKKSGAKKLLAVGLIGGIIAILVAVWKASKPIEDPWENEAPNPEAHLPVEEREVSVEEVRKILSDEQ